ncbi:Protein of unknown function (DUF2934) [Paraburkholderia sp. BL18I3N2]|uniref:DUF2934 domain-containing protein n=1 Tax=Paraburkholderia sp. BL18I3N2 TaxID=1938799 RepID=UPI000D04D915|nr:DUF2934 domain-containing protein [Paraburkholderia sp. BL18I3N2]PRX33365.1 Protein of unknown function (DUF2934) [Paraburkholderia sp. BL18I3N2]
MTSAVSDSDIRGRAYELWLQAGSPEGRADEFWEQARSQLAEPEPPNQEDTVADSDDFAEAPTAKPAPK